MEENSIKEDIEKVEDFIDIVSVFLQKYGTKIPKKIIDQKSYIAIEHILSDYKRVLKKNEEWDRKFCNLQNLYFKLQDESESKRKEWQEAYKSEKKMKNEYVKLYQDILLKENVIPVQKVKDKIEELNKEIKSCTEIDAIFKIKQQQILQELLGSEE